MVNILIIAAVLAVLGGAGYYVYKEKKSGAACVGCPNSRNCASHSSCCAEHNNMAQ
jgi:hypothetical protein